MAGVISPSLTFFSNGFLNNVPLAFSLYFHNQEKGLFWDFHELSIHQQNEWKRLDHLELVAKILFCQMVLIPLHLSILLLVAYIEWGQEKYVNETVVYIQGSPILLAVTFSFRVVLCSRFFFPFMNFIITI